ncbi:uncharacterized protein TEOVI_000725000 [Trypanosoma equiperdum]|uniref:Uncharacterized protein n=2 Tax=Trypanozoon TaxID=39700 RepID=Q4GZ78_TRYB2|nr:hypothetical protein, unlikely [Trypanosoma brucei brucei TREU927]CAJ16104.1 hypothetical protein, unlikely [Trypanosoma brucei brucei TREU927]SCU64498.1 hypothetical protein, conserved [Trypanosoma equiperdum]
MPRWQTHTFRLHENTAARPPGKLYVTFFFLFVKFSTFRTALLSFSLTFRSCSLFVFLTLILFPLPQSTVDWLCFIFYFLFSPLPLFYLINLLHSYFLFFVFGVVFVVAALIHPSFPFFFNIYIFPLWVSKKRKKLTSTTSERSD